MNSYEMCISTRIVFGKGRRKEIGERLREYTDKVLLVYGGGSIRRTGLYDEVIASLKENGIAWSELSGIKANPVLSKVNEGISICRKEEISFILAVGGGSVIDTAKAIAAGVLYNGDVWDFFSKKASIKKALPIATILTMPGTGSEVSVNVILTNEKTNEKVGALHDCLRPVFSILDPELCLTIPMKQAAPAIYDMFSHTFERYMSRVEHTDVVDGIGEGVMKAVIKNGLAVMRDPKDIDAWSELMIASDFSHNMITGFGKAADWGPHGMEEVVSGIYDIPHGAGLSIITPAWMKYVYQKHLPLFVQFAVNVMGVQGDLRNEKEIAEEGIRRLEDFSDKLGLPRHFNELDIDDSRFEFMAKRACSYKPNGKVGRLEELSWEDIVEIYKLAL